MKNDHVNRTKWNVVGIKGAICYFHTKHYFMQSGFVLTWFHCPYLVLAWSTTVMCACQHSDAQGGYDLLFQSRYEQLKRTK